MAVIAPGIQAFDFDYYSNDVGRLEISCTSQQAQIIQNLIDLIDWQKVETAAQAVEAAKRAP